MIYVPSPISVNYDFSFQAIVNRSGRMQYYRIEPGKNRERIARSDFIAAYNKSRIVALNPLQDSLGNQVFQLEFYTITE